MKIIIVIENTSENALCSFEHGLSIYIETTHHKLLLDTGTTDAFISNANVLGIDIKQIDTVFLSHGHYDHSGGIIPFSKINSDARIYMQKTACGDFYHDDRYIGIDKQIASLQQVHFIEGNMKIDNELSVFSGITGRRHFAKSNLLLSKRVNGINYQDNFEHEQCLVIKQNTGNILISGCAHNGILNILDKYKELYGNIPVAVISGFHMMKKTDYTEDEIEVIRSTAMELKEMDTYFYTGHCTGHKAFEIMKPIMEDKLIQIHSGTIIENL